MTSANVGTPKRRMFGWPHSGDNISVREKGKAPKYRTTPQRLAKTPRETAS